jgi:hypothetical protein
MFTAGPLGVNHSETRAFPSGLGRGQAAAVVRVWAMEDAGVTAAH